MTKLVLFLVKLFLSCLFTFLLIEIGLRLFPGVLPLDLLLLFAEQPRKEIAQRLGLATQEATVLLERDDGGPELRLFKPYTRLLYRVQEIDTMIETIRDEIGFCNPEGSYQSPQIDILTLGDSFTVCHAVSIPNTWTSQLSTLTGYSTYNLGHAGIGVHEYLQIFKKFGPQKSPKIVIMNIYEGNDLRDAKRYYEYLHGLDEDEEEEQPSPTLFIILENYSYAYNLIQSLVEYLQNPASARGTAWASPEPRGINFRYHLVFSDGVAVPFNLKDTDEDEVRFARRLKDKTVNIGISEVLIEALTTFVKLSKRYNFRPVVTYTPSAYTAYANYVVFENPALNELMPWFSQEQRRFLTQTGQELGYIFIDLTPDLQAAAQAHGSQALLYYQYDLHLTSIGHTALAQGLNRQLRQRGLIEETSAGHVIK